MTPNGFKGKEMSKPQPILTFKILYRSVCKANPFEPKILFGIANRLLKF